MRVRVATTKQNKRDHGCLYFMTKKGCCEIKEISRQKKEIWEEISEFINHIILFLILNTKISKVDGWQVTHMKNEQIYDFHKWIYL